MIAFGSQSSNEVWSLQLFRTTVHAREHVRVSRSLTKRHAVRRVFVIVSPSAGALCPLPLSLPPSAVTHSLLLLIGRRNWRQWLVVTCMIMLNWGCDIDIIANRSEQVRDQVSALCDTSEPLNVTFYQLVEQHQGKGFVVLCEEHVIHHLANKWLFMDMPGLRCPQISKILFAPQTIDVPSNAPSIDMKSCWKRLCEWKEFLLCYRSTGDEYARRSSFIMRIRWGELNCYTAPFVALNYSLKPHLVKHTICSSAQAGASWQHRVSACFPRIN